MVCVSAGGGVVGNLADPLLRRWQAPTSSPAVRWRACAMAARSNTQTHTRGSVGVCRFTFPVIRHVHRKWIKENNDEWRRNQSVWMVGTNFSEDFYWDLTRREPAALSPWSNNQRLVTPSAPHLRNAFQWVPERKDAFHEPITGTRPDAPGEPDAPQLLRAPLLESVRLQLWLLRLFLFYFQKVFRHEPNRWSHERVSEMLQGRKGKTSESEKLRLWI